MNRVELARLLRAVGLVCAIGALVVGHQGHRYWDDGSLAAFVLVLTIPAALGVAAAFALERPGLDRLSLPVGSLLAGLFLFVPVSIAAAGGDVNASEALGLCVSLVPLSLLVARPARRARAAVAAGLLPTIGSVLLLVAIWPDAISAGSRGYSYWSWPEFHHAFGISLLVLAIVGLGAVALFLHGGRLAAGSAVAIAAIGGGYGLYIPVVGAFGFDFLTTGVWLGAAGGLVLLLAGVLTALRR
jgi:hypothetical protein